MKCIVCGTDLEDFDDQGKGWCPKCKKSMPYGKALSSEGSMVVTRQQLTDILATEGDGLGWAIAIVYLLEREGLWVVRRSALLKKFQELKSYDEYPQGRILQHLGTFELTKEKILKQTSEKELWCLFHTFKEYHNEMFRPPWNTDDKQLGEIVAKLKANYR